MSKFSGRKEIDDSTEKFYSRFSTPQFVLIKECGVCFRGIYGGKLKGCASPLPDKIKTWSWLHRKFLEIIFSKLLRSSLQEPDVDYHELIQRHSTCFKCAADCRLNKIWTISYSLIKLQTNLVFPYFIFNPILVLLIQFLLCPNYKCHLQCYPRTRSLSLFPSALSLSLSISHFLSLTHTHSFSPSIFISLYFPLSLSSCTSLSGSISILLGQYIQTAKKMKKKQKCWSLETGHLRQSNESGGGFNEKREKSTEERGL